MSGLLWEAPFYLQFFEHLLPAVMAEQDRKKLQRMQFMYTIRKQSRRMR